MLTFHRGAVCVLGSETVEAACIRYQELLTVMGPLIGIEMGGKKTQTDNLVSLWEKQYRLQ